MNGFHPSKKGHIDDKIVISMRINSSKIDKIDKIAGAIDVSRNELINQCIDFALDNLDIDDKKKNKELVTK